MNTLKKNILLLEQVIQHKRDVQHMLLFLESLEQDLKDRIDYEKDLFSK